MSDAVTPEELASLEAQNLALQGLPVWRPVKLSSSAMSLDLPCGVTVDVTVTPVSCWDFLGFWCPLAAETLETLAALRHHPKP
jgi:hypothetical protein